MRKIGLLILVMVCAISCKKDDDKPIPDDPVFKEEILFGDYSNMNVCFYDAFLIGGLNDPQYFDIDIDQDSVFDIRFVSEIWESPPAVGQHPRSEILCLNNNIELYGYFKTDTLFLNRLTRILSGPNNTVEIYEYYNYTCYRRDEADSILAIYENVFKIQPKDKNEKLCLMDVFKSDSIILRDDWYYYPYEIEETGQDTITYIDRTFFNNCDNSLSLDEIKYIGFKMTIENIEKLGWIKVCIMNNNKVVILETAIQEELTDDDLLSEN